MTMTISGNSGLVFPDGSGQETAIGRNRIINGDMVVSQRNAGASTTPTTNATYNLDRWRNSLTQSSKFSVQQNAGSVTPPAGFTNYLGVTSTSAYSITSGDIFGQIQVIEGFNISDLGWGTANAKTVTLSFWVRSSLTGTFGGSLSNGGASRSYPFTYTISSANTWEQKTITITGDTSGTWNTTNGVGILLNFSLGTGSTYSGTAGAWAGSEFYSATGATSVVGTNGATFYITGVQLERNTTATPFEWIPYSTELALCQRYFNTSYFGSGSAVGTATTTNQVAWIAQSTGNYNGIALTLPVQMRVAPAITTYSGLNGSSGNMNTVSTTISAAALTASTTSFNVFANNVATSYSSNLYFHYTASSEL
jgi:hypothetical protein